MSILSVKNLEKKFGDLTVLKDISFDNITALYESVRDDHIWNDHDRWKDFG